MQLSMCSRLSLAADSPVVGTAELPLQPFEAIASGRMQDKPIIFGVNRDEVTTTMAMAMSILMCRPCERPPWCYLHPISAVSITLRSHRAPSSSTRPSGLRSRKRRRTGCSATTQTVPELPHCMPAFEV